MSGASITWPPHQGGRTFQRVRRNSLPLEAGAGFFRPLKKVTVVHLQRAVERLAATSFLTRRRDGKAAELGLPTVRILHAMLFRFMDWKTGQCDPTYEQLREATGHARETIAKALGQLKKLGVLEVLRRFTLVPDADGKGPQVQQAPNAYRFALPPRLRALLGLVDADQVIPDDAAVAARDGRRSNLDAAVAIGEQEAERTGKPNLGSELARLGRAVTQREFRK